MRVDGLRLPFIASRPTDLWERFYRDYCEVDDIAVEPLPQEKE